MRNQDIYLNDPARKLVNQGVVRVNDDATQDALDVLRYELETFVCEGQYEKGLRLILETYLDNIEEKEQPGAWVSGFYGSGKSHLLKMLRALWVDTPLPGGATARGVVSLPEEVAAALRELSTQAKRHGGVHAASGNLAEGADGSFRLLLLRIVFKSVGLPEHYWNAKFVMWLKREGVYNRVRERVEKGGANWDDELDNFYVSEPLHEALIAEKPSLFASAKACSQVLVNLYPIVQDISSDEMVKTLKQALSKGDKFPLTLIALDEVQLYIGEDSARSMAVQDAIEACCKNVGGKLLFVGTGQTAITGTPSLKRFEGRVTVRVELSDADVDAVVRKVVLAKKPEAIPAVEAIMTANLGEISRHLSATTIGHRQKDTADFAADYPILPTRRRFWETTLHALDQTSTDSQLRNQLDMVHKAVQAGLGQPLGHVVPADRLYFESANKLLQARRLPRKVHEATMTWVQGTPDQKLTARSVGLVFLINRVAASNTDVNLHATVDTLADLMVEDLAAGSGALRAKLPGLLDKCELLIKVGDEYRIQTEESAAWTDDFLSERSELTNAPQRVDNEREDRIHKRLNGVARGISLSQGDSNVSREVVLWTGESAPQDAGQHVYVWVRHGWNVADEKSVQADAAVAGNESPTVFVHIPKRSADELRAQLMDYKAATATLSRRGVPTNSEGIEARGAMETIQQLANRRIDELLDEAFSGAHVYQGGGNEVLGEDLSDAIEKASSDAFRRLYPRFAMADDIGWAKVYEKAQKGAPDALTVIGYKGEPPDQPVCKEVLGFIGGGKRGTDIRAHLMASPFGWPQDAVDGALQVLLVAGVVRVQDEHGGDVVPTHLERKAIGKSFFKVESARVTVPQIIQVRKLYQLAGAKAVAGGELIGAQQFLERVRVLAGRAGGDPPLPQPPDTSLLGEIAATGGNELLLALYNNRDALEADIVAWTATASLVEARLPAWVHLTRLLRHVVDLQMGTELKARADAIADQRMLLAEPDPVAPLVKLLEGELRQRLQQSYEAYGAAYGEEMKQLEKDTAWRSLTVDERDQILQQCDVRSHSIPDVGTGDQLVAALEHDPLHVWSDRVNALKVHIDKARELAAKAVTPETQTVEVPRRTLNTQDDVDAWLHDVEGRIRDAIGKGPVVLL